MGRGATPTILALLCACQPADPAGAPIPEFLSERVEVGPEEACARPATGLPAFEDVTVEVGLAYVPCTPPWNEAEDGVTSVMIEAGGGFAIADLDADGWHDAVFADFEQPLRVFFGLEGGRFEGAPAAELGLATGGAWVNAVTAADADGDGDLDLWLGAYGRGFLFRNEGDRRFVDATDELGLRASGNLLVGAFADADRDGDLDLFVGAHSAGSPGPDAIVPNDPDFLFVREGAEFVDRTEALLPPDAPAGQAFGASWFDANGDGLIDLYVVNDGGDTTDAPGNRFFANLGDLAFDEIDGAGADVRMMAMGVATGDYDRDGDLDLHVSDVGPTLLLRNDGDHVFTDLSLEVRAFSTPERGEISWGTEFLDVDGDGFLEVFTAFGYMPTKRNGPLGSNNRPEMPDQLWTRAPDGWRDVGPELGAADPGWTRGAQAVDLDGDGALDLVTFRLDGGPRVLRGACTANAFLRVRLDDSTSENRFGVGATVVASVRGQRPVTGLLRAGSSAMSAGPPEVHLGLGQADRVDLVVRWPDGQSESFGPVPTRRSVTIHR